MRNAILVLFFCSVSFSDTTYVPMNLEVTKVFDRFDKSWIRYATHDVILHKNGFSNIAVSFYIQNDVYFAYKSSDLKTGNIKFLLANEEVIHCKSQANSVKLNKQAVNKLLDTRISSIRFNNLDYDCDSAQSVSIARAFNALISLQSSKFKVADTTRTSAPTWKVISTTPSEKVIVAKHGISDQKLADLLCIGSNSAEYLTKPWEKYRITESLWFKLRRKGYSEERIRHESVKYQKIERHMPSLGIERTAPSR